ncbi:ABC transporter permease [Rhodococcus sp. WS3]|uniref:ABC transporter permease n=1 Tax=Rhodococcus sp. WS3 TaxID=2486271 RepID=UPI00114166EC|nr:ABC transporter permease [Rhodococcus sp. WS3]ROZ49004.1 ABC transporter permease [Rhodococcus sp. WS3]
MTLLSATAGGRTGILQSATVGRVGNLLRIVLGRVVRAASLMLAVIVVTFLLLSLAPGDPTAAIGGDAGVRDAATAEAIRAEYGLDRPLIVQIGTYASRILHGDFGQSFVLNEPVWSAIAPRIGPTLLLSGVALVAAVVAGTLLGVFTARRPRKLISHVVTVVSIVGFAMPSFWIGLMLIILFAVTFPIFPIGGMNSTMVGSGFFEQAADTLWHLVLPAFTLGVIYLAQYSRLSRASMLEVLGSDYVRTAHAKGLAPRIVVYKHALRNALIPIVTVVGTQFGHLLSGAVVVEVVFNWPGLGGLAYQSIQQRDTPLLLGILLLSAAFVLVANIMTDLIYRIIDPRIRIRRTK